MKLLDSDQQTLLAGLLTNALRSARMESAGFGFPKDRIEVTSVHSGEAAGIREGDVLHPDDYVRTITENFRHSWIVTPIERALTLLGFEVPGAATPEPMPPRTRRTTVAVGAGQVVDAEFVEPAAKPHPHADLIAKWLPDTTQPLWLWNTCEWVMLPSWELLTDCDSVCSAHIAIGAKPTAAPRRMCTLAGVEFPEPTQSKPAYQATYFAPSPSMYPGGSKAIQYTWMNDERDYIMFRAGLIHLTEREAEMHCEALLAATKQAIEAAK